jgi:outer membrane protein assembly factor BamB
VTDRRLRTLERAATAADDAASWSRLAAEHARAGRPWAAHGAAARAVARAPTDPARSSLRGVAPSGRNGGFGGSAPWPGLRGLGAPRELRLPWKIGPEAHDVGHGLVLVRPSAGKALEAVAVDLVTGDVRWRRRQRWPSLQVCGDWLLEHEQGTWTVVDAATGAQSGESLVIPAVGALRGKDDRTLSDSVLRDTFAPVGQDTLVGLLDLDVCAVRRARSRSLAFVRPGTGAVTTLELPKAKGVKLSATGTTALVHLDRQQLLAYGQDGARRWKRACAGVVVAAIDDRVFVAAPGDRAVRVLDATTGKAITQLRLVGRGRPALGAVTDAALILDRGDALMALDRRTLERLWERPRDFQSKVFGTGDAVVVHEWTHDEESGSMAFGDLVSLDPATGVTLATIDTRDFAAPEAMELVGGRLVLVHDDRLTLIEAPDLAPRVAPPSRRRRPRGSGS